MAIWIRTDAPVDRSLPQAHSTPLTQTLTVTPATRRIGRLRPRNGRDTNELRAFAAERHENVVANKRHFKHFYGYHFSSSHHVRLK
jgi:hypothetical protein